MKPKWAQKSCEFATKMVNLSSLYSFVTMEISYFLALAALAHKHGLKDNAQQRKKKPTKAPIMHFLSGSLALRN